jgi:photosystem II stability/assembly factor-like uncharacterized protein
MRLDKPISWTRIRLFVGCAAFVLVHTAALPVKALEAQWVPATPFGGDFLDLEQAPSSPQTLYGVTVFGDLFVSMDGGTKWSARPTITFPGSPYQGLLAIDPRHPNILYAITNSYVLVRSLDGGLSWTNLNLESSFTLTFDHEAPGVLYAGTACGLYRSADHGDAWEVLAFAGFQVLSLVIDPFDAQNFLLFLGDGTIWRSTDRGLTWRPTECPGCFRAVFDVAHRGTVYAFGATSSETTALVRSRDGGRSWSTLPVGLGRLSDLASSPDGTLYAVGNFFGVLASDEQGTRWRPRPTAFGGKPSDFLSRIIVSIGSPGDLFAAGSQGIWKSTDRGSRWRLSNDGVADLDLLAVWADPAGQRGVFATSGCAVEGCQPQEVFHSRDGGASWRILAVDFWCFPSDRCEPPDRLLAYDPKDSRILYGFGFDGQFDYFTKSTEGGRNWSKLPLPYPYGYYTDSEDGLDLTAFYLDPLHPETVFVGGDYFARFGGGFGVLLLRSDDGGKTWHGLTTPDGQLPLGIAAGPARTLLELSCGALYASSDSGATWQAEGQGLPAQLCIPSDRHGKAVASAQASLLLSDPRVPSTLYVGTPGAGIYRSSDGGVTFQPFGHGLETAAITSLVVDSTDSSKLYAGVAGTAAAATRSRFTPPGVYRWDAVLGAWTPMNAGLPDETFTGVLTLEAGDPPVLYAVTLSGVYRLPIP